MASFNLSDWTYTLDTDKMTCALTAYNGTDTDMYIPGLYIDDDNKSYQILIENAWSNVFPYTLTSVTISAVNGVKAKLAEESLLGMFTGHTNLTSIDLSGLDTSNATTMSSMFFQCHNLTSLNLDGLDTSNVIDMNTMFYQCSKLTTLDVSSFDTSNVLNMSQMFYECSSLTALDLSNFNTPTANEMSYMFYNCSSLTTLNISNFNTENVVSMTSMFDGCRSLTTLDVSSFDTSKTYDVSSMFNDCSNLVVLDLSNFNIGSSTGAYAPFLNCSSLGIVDVTGATLNEDALASFYEIGSADKPLIILSDDSTIADHDWSSQGKKSTLTFDSNTGTFPKTSLTTETYQLDYVYASSDALLTAIDDTINNADLPINEYCVFIEWDLSDSTSNVTPSNENTKELLDLYNKANGTYDAEWLKIYNDLNLWQAIYETVGEPLTLPNVEALTALDAPSRNIQDLTGIEYSTNLEHLVLSDNPLYNIEKLQALTKLETLELEHIFLRDATPLKDMTNLTLLNLNNNYISNIYPLSKLTNLETLQLANNEITDICQLRKLTNLETLDLSSNEIADISTLSKLTNLKTLNLDDNRISDLSALGSLTDLTSLSVADQRIILQFRTVPTLKHTLRAKSPFVKPDGTNMLLVDPGSKNPYTYDETKNLISWTEALTTKKGTRVSKVSYSPITVGNVTTTYSAYVTQHYAEWIPLRLHFRYRSIVS